MDLGLIYRPNFAGKKLGLGVQVRNVFNSQETLQVDVTSEDDPYTVSNTYMVPIGRQEPRTVVFTTVAAREAADVPPVLSSTAIWSPIPSDKEIGREEALFRRTDHRLPA